MIAQSLLFVDGIVHPLEPRRPACEAVGIHNDRISYVGSTIEGRQIHSRAKVVSLKGFTVIPGLIDSHIHIGMYSERLHNVDLSHAQSLDEALAKVREKTLITPPGAIVRGGGWNKNDWPNPVFPHKGDLDSVSTEHPIVLSSKDGHAVWINSAAMSKAEINKNTPDPPGGKIEREPGSDTPTGILFEAAESLAWRIVEDVSDKQLEPVYRQGLLELASQGLTGARAMDGMQAFRIYQALNHANCLPLRISIYLPTGCLDDLAYCGIGAQFGDDRLRIGGVKSFFDGALGSQTAEMFEPYETDPKNFGISVCSAKDMEDRVRRATKAGLPLVVHAIGDRANRRLLDIAERVRNSESGTVWPRHAIEHAQLLAPEDIPRLAQLGMIASMQPLHVSGDWKMADLYWGERSKGAYVFRSLLEHNTRLAFGSDAPVESPDPLLGIRAAVTRTDLENQPDGGWYPGEKLTPLQALRAYTSEAAYAMGTEQLVGTLEIGKKADLVVLDKDPLSCDPRELSRERVVLTMSDGDVVYSRGDLKIE